MSRGRLADDDQPMRDDLICWRIVAIAEGVALVSVIIGLIVYVATPSTLSVMAVTTMGARAELASTSECPVSLVALQTDLYNVRDRFVIDADRHASIKWETYTAAPIAQRRVMMRQSDFDTGTLHIVTPGVFTLAEDIVFSPNVDDSVAAIAVESDNVFIDLAGHSLQQSMSHFMQQGVPFTLIQLANQVSGIIISNGALGQSSQHAIFGDNGGQRVLLQALTISDVQVAAISLAGFKDVLIESVRSSNQASAVPVLSTYSTARHLMRVTSRLLTSPLLRTPKLAELIARRDALYGLMAHAYSDVVTRGSINIATHPEAHALFANVRGVSDSTAYSLAVSATERIYVRDCTFADTHAHVIEVVALVSAENVTVCDPSGALLRLVDSDGRTQLFNENGGYVGNALADLQIAVMDAALDATNRTIFGVLHAPAAVVQWAHGELTLQQLVTDAGFKFWRNGDAMFHVNKGAIGIHIDGARDVCLHRVTVAGVSNTGKQGHTWPLPGEVTAADGGHPAQGRQRGYLGADARGMSISNSTHVYFQEMHVAQVHSFRGLARGIDIFNDASDVHCGSGNTIDAVSTLIDPKGDYTMGPKVGSAIGFRVSGASAPTTYGGHAIAITNIVSGAFEQAHIHSIGTEPSL